MKVKKLLAAILAIAMVLGMMSFPAFADGDEGGSPVDLYNEEDFNDPEELVNNESEVPADKVAQIGNEYYATLEAAIAAAQDGDTVTLLADVTTTTAFTVKPGVTLDGNGKTLTNSAGHVMSATGATVKNLTIVANGDGYAIYTNGNTTVESCTFNGSTNWQPVYVKDEGAPGVVVTGCTFNTSRSMVIRLDTKFTNNTLNGQKGLTIASSANGAVVTGNTFNNARLDVYPIDNSKVSIEQNKLKDDSFVELEEETYDEPVDLSGNYLSEKAREILNDENVVVASYYTELGENGELSGLQKGPDAVAQIGDDKYYASINGAIAAAQDGETVTLLKDVAPSARIQIVDKSITLDLGGKALTQAESADYLIVSNAEVLVKNGTIFGTLSWIGGHLTLGDGTTSLIVNESVDSYSIRVEAYNSATVTVAKNAKVFGWHPAIGMFPVTYSETEHPTLHVYGELISEGYAIATNGTYPENQAPTEINIYEGATVRSNQGTAIYAPQTNGVLNITGGLVSGAVTGIELRAGELNMTGGEVIGEGVPTEGNSNESGRTVDGAGIAVSQHTTKQPLSVNISGGKVSGYTALYQANLQNNDDEAVDKVTLDIKGGEFAAINGGVEAVYSENKTGFITGGTFSHMPDAKYLPKNTPIGKNSDGTYTVGGAAKKIEVAFIPTEEPTVYDIVLRATDGEVINRLNSADLTFKLETEDKISYEIIGVKDTDGKIYSTINNVDGDRYEFHYNLKNEAVTGTGTAITIGQVIFEGYGDIVFSVDTDAGTNIVNTTTVADNIVSDYVVGDEVGKGTLVVNEAVEDNDGDDTPDGLIETTFDVPTKTLGVNVTFPNAVEYNAASYQDMHVTISGGDLLAPITVDLGEEITDSEEADDEEAIAKVTATTGGNYVVSAKLTRDRAYTVTVEGQGYRTARYTVTMTDDKELTFWNNVMDADTYIEDGVGTASKTSFLAGDIVKDNNINIYDLSAVVSYFGTITGRNEYSEYAKYDLNRDGVIDSKDVAYVLVSWGN